MQKLTDIYWDNRFYAEFSNQKKLIISFKTLRYLCPCAACVDELSGQRIIKKQHIADDIMPLDCVYIGNYAIKITWSDNHSSGIYSFNYLAELLTASLPAED